MTSQPTDQQLDETRTAIRKAVDLYFSRVDQPDAELLAEHVYECLSDEFDRLYRIEADTARLRAELAAEQAQHAFTLRQRNNRSERLNYLRDVAKSGQTELLVEEALNTLAASVNDHVSADGDEMAASLRRDGFADDEIADMLAPRTERSRWVAVADALNAVEAAGMAVGIDLDGTLTDRNAWSVVWDRDAGRWTVAGYEDDEGLSGPCDCGEGAVHYTTAGCPAARRAAARPSA
ncbi:hypothetical protein [Streptomyces sp. NPDC093591]|uniref:hypothetical protein n=1 Tax=Streptomyces sp. NPDC093591 TaxID=3366044 RepID=UPI0038170867